MSEETAKQPAGEYSGVLIILEPSVGSRGGRTRRNERYV